MLKQEMRKLKEEDLKTTKMRMARLENSRKMDIIDRDIQSKNMVEESKQKERLLLRTKYEENVKANIEKEHFKKSLDAWAQAGFHSTRTRKNNKSTLKGAESYD